MTNSLQLQLPLLKSLFLIHFPWALQVLPCLCPSSLLPLFSQLFITKEKTTVTCHSQQQHMNKECHCIHLNQISSSTSNKFAANILTRKRSKIAIFFPFLSFSASVASPCLSKIKIKIRSGKRRQMDEGPKASSPNRYPRTCKMPSTARPNHGQGFTCKLT